MGQVHDSREYDALSIAIDGGGLGAGPVDNHLTELVVISNEVVQFTASDNEHDVELFRFQQDGILRASPTHPGGRALTGA